MGAARYIWIHDSLRPASEGVVPFVSAAVQYGFAVFEGIRCYATDKGPAVFRMDEHVERLLDSAHIVGFRELPVTAQQVNTAINQTAGTTGLATSTIDGLVAWGNTNYGARLFTGSLVKVRNSVLLDNTQYGVLVSTGTAGTAAGQDVSKLDLGTVGSFGKNYLQTPQGALGTNFSGGICLGLSAYTGAGMLTEVLPAAGNFMVSGTATTVGTTEVDCSMSTATISRGTCGGLRSAGVNAAALITASIDFSNCQ